MYEKRFTLYLIKIYLCFVFKNVAIHAQNTKYTTVVVIDPFKMPNVPPQEVFTFPGIKFEGIDYEDHRHVKHFYPHLQRKDYYEGREDWRCWYDQLRCIRFQSNNKPVCSIDKYTMMYSFISICELEYHNCVLEFKRFHYNGDERECWYLWGVISDANYNRALQEEYGLYADHIDSWFQAWKPLKLPWWSDSNKPYY